MRTGQCQNREKRTHGSSSKSRVSLRRQEEDERIEGRSDTNALSLSFSADVYFCAVIVWYLCISAHLPNTIHLCKHTTLSPSFLLSSSRVCPLVLLAWYLMEPVPHTGPLRDYAGANHRSCDSSISGCSWNWREGLCPCCKPATELANGARELKARQLGFIGDFRVLS